jgi:hypothetical protein
MKNGKFLEEVVRVIHETLKANDQVLITKNKKVKDRHGDRREFDVFIEGSLNDEAINIAVECKDHSRKVSVSHIEAYITKCDRVPNIHKKIFVSRKGYTSGAIKAAADRDVVLYTLQNLDSADIFDWLGMTMIRPAFVMPIITAKRVTTSSELQGEIDFSETVRGGGFPTEIAFAEVVKLVGQAALLSTGGFTGKFFLFEGGKYVFEMPFAEGTELVKEGVTYKLEALLVEVRASIEKPDAKIEYHQYQSVEDGGMIVDTASSTSDTGTIRVVKKVGEEEATVHASFDLDAAKEVFRMKVERFNAGDEEALT